MRTPSIALLNQVRFAPVGEPVCARRRAGVNVGMHVPARTLRLIGAGGMSEVSWPFKLRIVPNNYQWTLK
jgi:hypothetical protein